MWAVGKGVSFKLIVHSFKFNEASSLYFGPEKKSEPHPKNHTFSWGRNKCRWSCKSLRGVLVHFAWGPESALSTVSAWHDGAHLYHWRGRRSKVTSFRSSFEGQVSRTTWNLVSSLPTPHQSLGLCWNQIRPIKFEGSSEGFIFFVCLIQDFTVYSLLAWEICLLLSLPGIEAMLLAWDSVVWLLILF